jgi:oligoendopeptidase F
MNTLGKAGIDVRQRTFWEKGFGVLERALDALAELPRPSSAKR